MTSGGRGILGNVLSQTALSLEWPCVPFYAFCSHVSSSAPFRGQKDAGWVIRSHCGSPTPPCCVIGALSSVAPVLSEAITGEVWFLGVREQDLEIDFSVLESSIS